MAIRVPCECLEYASEFGTFLAIPHRGLKDDALVSEAMDRVPSAATARFPASRLRTARRKYLRPRPPSQIPAAGVRSPALAISVIAVRHRSLQRIAGRASVSIGRTIKTLDENGAGHDLCLRRRLLLRADGQVGRRDPVIQAADADDERPVERRCTRQSSQLPAKPWRLR